MRIGSSNFRIGDKVKYTNPNVGYPINANIGAVGIVRGIDKIAGDLYDEDFVDIKWIKSTLTNSQMNGEYDSLKFERMCNDKRECKSCKYKLQCITEGS